MDDHAGTPSNVAVANGTLDDPHPVWGDGDRGWVGRVEPGFVLRSWAVCLAVAVVLAVVATLIISALSSAPVLGETNTELGVLTIVSSMSTFIAFAVMMAIQLSYVAHDRLTNSLAVAALHVGLAVLLFAGEFVARSIVGESVSASFDGTWTDELGNAFTVLERSAAASVLACLLAPGMVPARGDRPSGTQTDVVPTDRQL